MGTRTATAGPARRTARAVSAAAGLLLAAAQLPPAAGAAPAERRFPPLAHPFQDSNWGGYVAQGRFTSVIGSWIEPHATCRTTADLFAPWVGLDGYGSQTVEQTGVQTDCSSGRPVLTAWYEMYPAPPVYWSHPVSEGDRITASVISSGAGRYTMTLTDSSKGWTEDIDKALGAQDVSAEAVIESPTQAYPVFGSLRFGSVSVDGRLFELTAPKALTSGGYTPGPLRLGSFTLRHSTAAPVNGPLPMRPRVIRYGPVGPPPGRSWTGPAAGPHPARLPAAQCHQPAPDVNALLRPAGRVGCALADRTFHRRSGGHGSTSFASRHVRQQAGQAPRRCGGPGGAGSRR